ncbi:MAG TPA: MMPL family transporter [Candidatus Polarisedimenticolia bacterium]|nr:MMPL family transporter [Candidatus Polarisedimenticolia bacterium]
MAGVKKGLFLRIEDFARRRYAVVFAVTALLVLASILLGKRLRLDGDILNLVPKGNRVVNTFREALQDFGSLDYLLVLLEAPKPAKQGSPAPPPDPAGTRAEGEPTAPDEFVPAEPEDEEDDSQAVEELQAFADILAARLQALPSVRYVEYKLDTRGPFFDFLRRNQMLFLPPSKLGEVAAKFSDHGIETQLSENVRQLTGPASPLAKRLLEADPLQISPLLFEAVLRNRGPIRFDLSAGYYSSKDGRSLLVIVKPVKPNQDLAFSKALVAEVNEAIRAAREEFARDVLGAEAPAAAAAAPASGDKETSVAIEARMPEVRLGGGYVIALEDSSLIMQDMVRNGILSFVVIVLLYYFCYRRFAAIAYSAVPLMVGQALTLAVAWIFLRQLNSATTGFTAMLMGLGTDFTIVMYGRYIEERQKGLPLDAALQKVMGSSAFGVFTGAITSAGTFYAMCITEYKGLKDFGFLVGSGILLCMVAILFLLPAMIAWNDGVRKRKRPVTDKLYLHSFGFERIMIWSTRHPKPVLVGSLLVTLVAGWHAWNVEFSDSVQDLRSPNNQGVRLQERIGKEFGASFNPMMVVAKGRDVETMMARNRAANRLLDGFVEDGTLLGYESIFTYLPPAEDQQAVIALLRGHAQDEFDVKRIDSTFRAALGRQGFREGVYDTYLATLPATLRPERPVTIDDLEHAGLDRFVRRYVHQEEDGAWTSVTYIFPSDPKARRVAPPVLVKALDKPKEGIEITGVNVASAELRRIFKRDAWRAVLLGIALVTVLLWLDFKSVWLTTLANIQVFLGVIWMLAAMHLLGIKMNFVNAFVTCMILGVGIDYGIHIIHRITQEGLSNPTGLLETGKAVVMAALTNVAGFGTIGLSNYPGLKSMGIVCAIGSVTCLLTALTTLPALLIATKTRVPPHEPAA